jgi:transcriptional regulator with XRE-family HTH domain
MPDVYAPYPTSTPSSPAQIRLNRIEKSLTFEQERLKLELSEGIIQAMQAKGLKQSDLARAIGKSRAYVAKILQGTTNFTVETVAALLWALDHRLSVDILTKQEAQQREQAWASFVRPQLGLAREPYQGEATSSVVKAPTLKEGRHAELATAA